MTSYSIKNEVEKLKKEIEKLKNGPDGEAVRKYDKSAGCSIIVVLCLLEIPSIIVWFLFGILLLFGEEEVSWPYIVSIFSDTEGKVELAIMLSGVLIFIIIVIMTIVCVIKEKILKKKEAVQQFIKLNAELKKKEAELKEYKATSKISDAASGGSDSGLKGVLIYAGARFNGHIDNSGTRTVYVDGNPYGYATPWLKLTLSSDPHTIYVLFAEHVGGRFYTVSSTPITVSGSNAVIYACQRTDSSVSLGIVPSKLYEESDVGSFYSSFGIKDEETRLLGL